MKNVLIALLGTAAVGLGACGTASSEPATQTQAQSAATTADDGAPGGKRPHQHPGPPPAAFEACVSKAVGDACTVTFGDESLAGKCVAPPSGAPDARIVCRPDKMPEHKPGHGGPGGHGPGGHAPPPEVFAACDGKAADTACSVTLGDRTLEGTCKAPPPGVNETRLGCAPSRPPPPGQ
jgi:hypothetical protein